MIVCQCVSGVLQPLNKPFKEDQDRHDTCWMVEKAFTLLAPEYSREMVYIMAFPLLQGGSITHPVLHIT